MGFALGCAEGDGSLGDAETEGLVGMTGGDAGRSRVGMLDEDGGVPPPGCTPGAKVALCGVCGPNGTPEAAQRDDECPPFECAARDAYGIGEEGGTQICARSSYQDAVANCADIGLCYGAGDPEACRGPNVAEVARAGVCQRIAGCDGETPPQVVLAPVGSPCEGGICNEDGVCEAEVVEGCEAFEGLTVCAAGVHGDGTPYCEVDVRPAPGGHCGVACREAANAHCLLAWQPGAAICEHGPEAGCFDPGERIICRCARP